MTAHRVIFTRIHGNGTETVIADEIPVTDLKVTRAVTGAGGLAGKITPEITRLRDRTGNLLVPGRTGVYALTEHDVVLGGGILTGDSERAGPDHSIDAEGHAGYLSGQPYSADRSWVQIDPAALIRHAWHHIQTRPAHDLGVTVDTLTTPVRIGTEPRDVSFETGTGEQVEFEAGPIRWSWWNTHDLGRTVDELAVETPIDYSMNHRWDGRTVRHNLRLGYPRLGRRRSDLTFTVGINVLTVPTVTYGSDVSDVIVLGSGEGSEQRRGQATRNAGGLGRTIAIVDKSLTSNSRCSQRARQHLAPMTGVDEIDRMVVHDHPNAPLHSWQIGDDIRIQGDGTGWAGDLDVWVRVLSDEIDVHAGTATLTLGRA